MSYCRQELVNVVKEEGGGDRVERACGRFGLQDKFLYFVCGDCMKRGESRRAGDGRRIYFL